MFAIIISVKNIIWKHYHLVSAENSSFYNIEKLSLFPSKANIFRNKCGSVS